MGRVDGAGAARIAPGSAPSRLAARLTRTQGLPSNDVRRVLVDHGGDTWLGTDAGFAIMRRNGTLGYLTAADGLPSDDVWAR